MFSEAGFAVCSADEIAHALLERENAVSKKVLKIFGRGILEKNGRISREKLGGLALNSKSGMRELEKIMHPAIKSAMKKFLDAGGPVAEENALLFKMKMSGCFDKIILVKCSDSVRGENIAARGISSSFAEKILFFQEDGFYPESLADFIIENTGGISVLRGKTKKCIELLLGKQ